MWIIVIILLIVYCCFNWLLFDLFWPFSNCCSFFGRLSLKPKVHGKHLENKMADYTELEDLFLDARETSLQTWLTNKHCFFLLLDVCPNVLLSVGLWFPGLKQLHFNPFLTQLLTSCYRQPLPTLLSYLTTNCHLSSSLKSIRFNKSLSWLLL